MIGKLILAAAAALVAAPAITLHQLGGTGAALRLLEQAGCLSLADMRIEPLLAATLM
jgi:hypothetical protein